MWVIVWAEWEFTGKFTEQYWIGNIGSEYFPEIITVTRVPQ
jgi:hypothetical protein